MTCIGRDTRVCSELRIAASTSDVFDDFGASLAKGHRCSATDAKSVRSVSASSRPMLDRASSTVSAQRARLDLNSRPARWQERYKTSYVDGESTAVNSSGGGLTLKKGIENLSAKSASRLERSLCMMARAV